MEDEMSPHAGCRCASSAAALSSPVYRYVVTHTPSGPVNTSNIIPFHSRFSFHCLDIMTFFGGLESVLGKPLSDADKSFQDVVTRHFVTFAKTGEHAPRRFLPRSRLFLPPVLMLASQKLKNLTPPPDSEWSFAPPPSRR